VQSILPQDFLMVNGYHVTGFPLARYSTLESMLKAIDVKLVD
jgi:hypothetical protein